MLHFRLECFVWTLFTHNAQRDVGGSFVKTGSEQCLFLTMFNLSVWEVCSAQRKKACSCLQGTLVIHEAISQNT